jgi:hypothetical protein
LQAGHETLQRNTTGTDYPDAPTSLGNDTDILNLVAENPPNYPGAWKKNRPEWQSLVGRDGKHSGSEAEEDDTGIEDGTQKLRTGVVQDADVV